MLTYRIRSIVVAVSVMFVWLAAAAYSAPRYKIVALDVLPGGLDSLAFGLNDQGQVVGDSRKDRTGHVGQSRPVVWDYSGQPTELWSEQVIGGHAADINNAGEVVGRYGVGSGIPLPTPGVLPGRAFVWSSTTGRRDIGLLPFGHSMATAINNQGQVAGTSEVIETIEIDGAPTEMFVPRAFIWDRMDGIRDLGTLGGNYSFGNAINNLGQVVGYAETADFTEYAFRWESGTGMQHIVSAMGTSSQAWGNNDVGEVVGVERNDRDQLPPTAFRWIDGEGVTLVPFPPGNFIYRI